MKKRMSRKPISKDRKETLMGVWVRPELKKKVNDFVNKHNTTFSAFIREAIEKFLEENNGICDNEQGTEKTGKEV